MELRLFAAVMTANVLAISPALALDPNLPAYQPATGLSGVIRSVGSDTMDNQMMLWAKGFRDQYPTVRIDIATIPQRTSPCPANTLSRDISPFT